MRTYFRKIAKRLPYIGSLISENQKLKQLLNESNIYLLMAKEVGHEDTDEFYHSLLQVCSYTLCRKGQIEHSIATIKTALSFPSAYSSYSRLLLFALLDEKENFNSELTQFIKNNTFNEERIISLCGALNSAQYFYWTEQILSCPPIQKMSNNWINYYLGGAKFGLKKFDEAKTNSRSNESKDNGYD
jgi:hypothetical protein